MKKPASAESSTNSGAIDVKPTYGSRSKRRGFMPAKARTSSRRSRKPVLAISAKSSFFHVGSLGAPEAPRPGFGGSAGRELDMVFLRFTQQEPSPGRRAPDYGVMVWTYLNLPSL